MHRLSRKEVASQELPFDDIQLFYSFTMSKVELGHTEVLGSLDDTEVVKAKPKSSNQPARYDPVIVLDMPDAEATGIEGIS